MPLPKKHASRFSRRCACIAFALITLLLSPIVGSPAQSLSAPTAPPGKTDTTAKADPLDRETPQSTVIGLLKHTGTGDFATAARYLQPPPGQELDLVQLVRQSRALRRAFRGDIALLSNDPEGLVEPGLPPGQVRAGTLVVGDTSTDVILVRVDDPQFGKIWLVSQETVAQLPALLAKIQQERPSTLDRIMPAALTRRTFLEMSLAQWLAWLLSIPVAIFLGWLAPVLVSAPGRFLYKLRKLPFRSVWETRVGLPLKCITAVLIHSFLVYLLRPPLLYRLYYFRFIGALLLACFAWLVSRIMDRGFDVAVQRTRTQGSGGESILVLVQRLAHILIFVIALVSMLAVFGVNVKTAVAGLGIGGFAVALAAQKTFENIVGGISLLMDKAVHVGDFCAIGGKFGTIEDIGLRSLKLRTLDQNLLVVPNGALAQMQFENLKARPKLLIDQTFSLRIETRVEQLHAVLDRVKAMLDSLPFIESDSARIRVNSFANAAFELEVFAYVSTGDWAKFTTYRQEVVLQIAEIVESAGARFAAPTRLTYLSSDAASDAQRTSGIGAASLSSGVPLSRAE
jgi:MscS family membrane protein